LVGIVRGKLLKVLVVGVVAATGAGCVGYGLYPPPPPGQPEIVDVKLLEFSIDAWPRLFRKGLTVFEVTNGGALEHTLVLIGGKVQETLAEDLGAGERTKASVELPAGTYRLLCPDSNHAKLGMTADLDVEDAAAWFRR
jgi:hypothetical protein